MAIIYPQLDGVRINENRTLPIALIQAIRKAYDYLAQVSTVTSSGMQLIDVTLTTALTTITPAAVGSDLVVVARQDLTGGRLIAWGIGVYGASTGIDTTANTISTFRFVRVDGVWIMVGQPTTGMTL